MVFSSTIFIFIFLPIAIGVYYNPFFKSQKFRNYFLFFASLLFYAWGEPVFVAVMLISITVTWFFGIKIYAASKWKKNLLVIGVAYHILLLFVFKYASFLIYEIGKFVQKEFVPVTINLPIGISFFTFQMMSYLFDIYYETAKPQKNILYVGLYIALFPQLIAGPIVRYKSIAEQIDSRRVSWDDFSMGIQRFVYGLSKKVLIANYMAQIADSIFDYLIGETTVAVSWLGAIAYTLQIYFDFSGYSDMAIGLGKMFGFHFEENFNYPYISKSVTDFWRRWHISLSSWFRDYVYIPLGGNRVSSKKWIRNMFLVWLLTGIWHGANWTFVVWGLFYFVILLFEKKTNWNEKLGGLSYLYTGITVIIAWVIFRADTLNDAVRYIGCMFGIGTTGFIDGAFISFLKSIKFVLFAAILGMTPIYKKICEWLKDRNCVFIEQLFICIIFFASLVQTISSSYNPFIYFNF